MGFGADGLNLLREKIAGDSFLGMARLSPNSFTRERKMGARDLVYYCLNKKGLCTNMEANNFFDKTGKCGSICAQSLFSQRKKLSPLVFKELNGAYINLFYSEYCQEVKLFKDHVILAIDGSDIEVPNTKACLKNYGISHNSKSGVARAGVSICFDLLNHYILDGFIDKYRAPEIVSAMKHIDRIKDLAIPQIYIMDRNYVSLGFMQYFDMNNLKFLCRLKANSHYMTETSNMETQDEIVEIKHTKHRRHRSRYTSEELFQAVVNKSHTRIRIVKYQLPTGEVEHLITNIEGFSYGDIIKLYGMRWGIETAYFSLKQKLQIEKFTSSVPQLIEQDFLSSVLAFNIIQTFKSEAEQSIAQSEYKYEMKTNENVAIGFVKNELILIMLENDAVKRAELYDSLVAKIGRYKVPIRKNRNFPIRPKTDNNNSINKLKSY